MTGFQIGTIVLAIVILIWIIYPVWIKPSISGESFEDSSVLKSSNGAVKAFVPRSKYYGEDNPIVSYANRIEKYGDGYDVPGQEFIQSQLLKTGVLKQGDLTAHQFYNVSNAHRYPIQQAGEPTIRSTINSYVAGTRSMRAVPIDPTESRIPDKPETPIAPEGSVRYFSSEV